MERLISFLFENKEWIFSGIGVTLLGWLGALIYRAFARNKTHRSAQTQSPRPSSLAVGPRLVTLPTGESIEPDGIAGITIKGDHFYNVCIVRRGERLTSEVSFFSTSSKREAESVARQAAIAINAAFATRTNGEREQEIPVDLKAT